MSNEHYDAEENPFSSDEPGPQHEVIGVCVSCGGEAHTLDAHGDLSCFPCAYHTAN